MDTPSPETGGKLFHLVTTRPIAVLCVVAAFVVFGVVSLGDLPTTLMPDLEYPQLTIRTDYPAAAPGEVEEKVSREIEERLGNVDGLVSRSSVSRAEQSDVLLQFAWGTDMLEATADVRDRLDRTRLDDGVERPQILRYNPAQDPVMRMMLFSTTEGVSLQEVRSFAEDILKPELSKIEGVAAVRVSGGAEREVRIALSERRLNQYRVTASQVVEKVRSARVDMSAGVISLAGLDVILRVVSTYDALEILRNLEVGGDAQSRVLLKDLVADPETDIAVVEKERESVTRFAGEETGWKASEGVLLEVLKEGDANIVAVSRRVWEALYGGDDWEKIRKARGVVETEEDDAEESAAAPGGKGGPPPKTGLMDRLPEGFGLKVLSDQSWFIEDAVNDVTATAVLGAFLAVLVLFLFLRSLKATALIAAAIPLSIITTFIPMRMTGVTLNLMSLGGLALGVGMLVDNSVVVLEAIARQREQGDPPLTAAIRGIEQVGGAIFASTMTTVAVFFPIVFVSGIAGQIFRDLALTVVFSLLASLVVAQFVVPALSGVGSGDASLARPFGATRAAAGHFFRPVGRGWRKFVFVPLRVVYVLMVWMIAAAIVLGLLSAVGAILEQAPPALLSPSLEGVELPEEQAEKIKTALDWTPWALLAPLLLLPLFDAGVFCARWMLKGMGFVLLLAGKPISLLFQGFWAATERSYPLLLRPALASPLPVLGVAVAAALFGGLLATDLDTELLPTFRQDEFYAHLAAPDGTRLELTDREAADLTESLLREDEVRARVVRVLLESGGTEQAGETRETGSHRARMVVSLAPNADPVEAAEASRIDLRELSEDSALFQGSSEFRDPVLFSVNTGLEVQILGDDYDRLGRAAEALAEHMKELRRPDGEPLLLEVRTSLGTGRPQVQFAYDRTRLERYGLTAEQVTRALRIKVGGEVGASFTSRGEDIDVLVELGGGDKASLEQVIDVEVAPGVRLRDVLAPGVEPTVEEGPSEIRRVGNERAVLVYAEPNGVALSYATERVQSLLDDRVVDLEGGRARFSGQVAEMEESTSSLLLALLLAVFLVYVVMAVQFESLVDPLVIMFSVPFAGVGVVAALWLLNMPVSIMGMLGAIVLAGIVVNNAIVLISRANQLRNEGQAPRQAALEAGRVRLRPIAITTLTTVLGLLPMTGWLDPFLPGAASAEAVSPALGKLVGLVIGGGEGAEVRKPLAITVIAGLLTSTLLTLIVIPVFWVWVNEKFGKRRSAKSDAPGAAGA